MTVLDPRTGYVRAMVGGDDADYWASDRFAGRVNLATGEGGIGPADGLGVQAVRAGRGARERHLALDVFAAPATIDIPLDDGERLARHERRGQRLRDDDACESATVNSVNTVYAQLIEQLGADTRRRDRRSGWGMRCCPRVERADARRCSPTCRPSSARTR